MHRVQGYIKGNCFMHFKNNFLDWPIRKVKKKKQILNWCIKQFLECRKQLPGIELGCYLFGLLIVITMSSYSWAWLVSVSRPILLNTIFFFQFQCYALTNNSHFSGTSDVTSRVGPFSIYMHFLLYSSISRSSF